MIIPIPIFFSPETKEDIELRGRNIVFRDELKRKRKLRNQIQEFKEKFKGDIRYSPEMYMFKTIFPNKTIEELNIKELMLLGFTSDFVYSCDINQ